MKNKIWMVWMACILIFCPEVPVYAAQDTLYAEEENLLSDISHSLQSWDGWRTGLLENIKENLLVYGALLAGIMILIVALIVILRKVSCADKKILPNHLCIEVLSGQYASKKKNFTMGRTLIIGSEKACDIIWREPEVSGQNARIFMHEEALRIEDLDSPCGTAINGMRIFAPNRLRSGDVVSIGEKVQFRVYFDMQ